MANRKVDVDIKKIPTTISIRKNLKKIAFEKADSENLSFSAWLEKLILKELNKQ